MFWWAYGLLDPLCLAHPFDVVSAAAGNLHGPAAAWKAGAVSSVNWLKHDFSSKSATPCDPYLHIQSLLIPCLFFPPVNW
jgi:hypothetical protein